MGDDAGLVAKRHDHHGEGKENQPLKMVVQRALQAGGFFRKLARGRAVAGGGGVAGAKLDIRGNGEDGVLGGLQKAREG